MRFAQTPAMTESLKFAPGDRSFQPSKVEILDLQYLQIECASAFAMLRKRKHATEVNTGADIAAVCGSGFAVLKRVKEFKLKTRPCEALQCDRAESSNQTKHSDHNGKRDKAKRLISALRSNSNSKKGNVNPFSMTLRS